MASTHRISILLFAAVILTITASVLVVASETLVVGGNKWQWRSLYATDDFYNNWASKTRFQINDTLKFSGDPVLVVTEDEYQKCRSVHPIFFSNHTTVDFVLDRAGFFYFISGPVQCEKGLKMIVKVLEPKAPSPTASTASPNAKSSAVELTGVHVLPALLVGVGLIAV